MLMMTIAKQIWTFYDYFGMISDEWWLADWMFDTVVVIAQGRRKFNYQQTHWVHMHVYTQSFINNGWRWVC